MRTLITGIITIALTCSSLAAKKIETINIKQLKKIATQSALIKAVMQSNEKHANIKKKEANKLNRQWRSERKNKQYHLIKKQLNQPLSKILKEIAKKSNYNNLVLVDRLGFNVAQAGITTYYWQSRQNFWKKVIRGNNTEGFYIGRTYKNRSTKQREKIISVPVLNKSKKINGVLMATIIKR